MMGCEWVEWQCAHGPESGRTGRWKAGGALGINKRLPQCKPGRRSETVHASLTALWLHPSCCAIMLRLAERFRQAGSAQQAAEAKLSAAEQASGGHIWNRHQLGRMFQHKHCTCSVTNLRTDMVNGTGCLLRRA